MFNIKILYVNNVLSMLTSSIPFQ